MSPLLTFNLKVGFTFSVLSKHPNPILPDLHLTICIIGVNGF